MSTLTQCKGSKGIQYCLCRYVNLLHREMWDVYLSRKLGNYVEIFLFDFLFSFGCFCYYCCTFFLWHYFVSDCYHCFCVCWCCFCLISINITKKETLRTFTLRMSRQYILSVTQLCSSIILMFKELWYLFKTI